MSVHDCLAQGKRVYIFCTLIVVNCDHSCVSIKMSFLAVVGSQHMWTCGVPNLWSRWNSKVAQPSAAYWIFNMVASDPSFQSHNDLLKELVNAGGYGGWL